MADTLLWFTKGFLVYWKGRDAVYNMLYGRYVIIESVVLMYICNSLVCDIVLDINYNWRWEGSVWLHINCCL